MATLKLRDRIKSERGAELVEFALTFPILLLVVLGILDFGLLFQRYEVLTNAAREGARIAVLDGYGQADVASRIDTYLDAAGLTATPTIPGVVTTPVTLAGNCTNLKTVTVSYPHNYLFFGGIIGYFGGSGFASRTLSATAEMRAETAAVACP
jgi:Flp pilus assembly protein TadG